MALTRYHIVTGPLEQLLAELDRYGADRTQQGKLEKARLFAAAMAELEAGADHTLVGRDVYAVGGMTLTRGGRVVGPRAELTSELRAGGWDTYLHDVDGPHEAAAAALEGGAASATVGRTEYIVEED